MPLLKTAKFSLLLLLVCYGIGVGQQQSVLTNKDVIDIVKLNLSEEIIAAKIKASTCKFDTSVEALKDLKAAGVPDSIILLMLTVSSSPAVKTAPKAATPVPTPTISEVENIKRPTKNGRAWQRGIVRDTEKEEFTTYGGTTTHGHVDDHGNITATTTRSSWDHERYTFAIEGDEYIYIIDHVLSWRWSKEAKVTVNGPTFYAIEGDKFYLLDEKGREFKLKIEKKVLKEKR